MDRENVKEILEERKRMKIRLIVQSIFVGLIVGLVIVINRVLIHKFLGLFTKLYGKANESIVGSILVVILVSLIGLLVGYMVKREPMISGSGIPQVKGRVINKIKFNWLRVFVLKFIGGVLSLSVGLSVGREGPSVQLGAAVGEGIADKFNKKYPVKKEFLITAGASAGLSAAFNSPLSGIIFALEEIHRSFSPLVLLGAMGGALTADFMSKLFLGMEPVLHFSDVQTLPLNYYWMLVIFGVIIGVLGILFSKGIYLFQGIYGKFKRVSVQVKVMVPFIITALVGLNLPYLLGGGDSLILSLVNENRSIEVLIVLFLIKFLLLLICFASGLPGGIFLPMLLLGALAGNVFGLIAVNVFGLPTAFIINFITLGMAGYFAAIVKAPITGIVLVMEMTGSFNHLLALSIVVIIAYITSEILGNEPIYDVLLEKLLKKFSISDSNRDKNKTLLEFVVEVGSKVEDSIIGDIEWPKECLIVAIKRGDNEIIPRGSTKLVGGDYIVALVNSNEASNMIDKINKLTLV